MITPVLASYDVGVPKHCDTNPLQIVHNSVTYERIGTDVKSAVASRRANNVWHGRERAIHTPDA